MRRLLALLRAAACALFALLVLAPTSSAAPTGNSLAGTPWFANQVGNATQVVSVVSTGGSNATIDIYQRTGTGWQALRTGVPTHVGSAGMAPQAKSGVPATPMGVYTLDSAFGTAANPGTSLPYTQVGPNNWWSGDDHSPTFNSMQVCAKAACPFNTADSENLQIPQYKHAVVMGVNKNKTPGGGAAFFFHTTDGKPTEGCVAVEDAQLVSIMKWLQPGAVIAITK
jgi:L,D-peptidoglycan transpeptidase YkuD (ErfK/YbiS/YcfS/YnhG family)